MEGQRKKVVVLGSGYAGATVASKLDRSKGIDVTMVSPVEGVMLHKIAGLRASVKGGNWIARAMVPLNQVVAHGQVIRSTAVSVNPEGKTVKLANGQELQYDALVIATGSKNFSPAEPPRSVTSKAEVEQYFKTMRESLSKTKNVVIVGLGAVGIELAAEIREYGQPDVKITLVGRSKSILQDGFAYKDKSIQAILGDLAKAKIDVITSDEVASHPVPLNVFEASPLVQTPEGVTLKSGKKIGCDLLVFATGSKLNTDFLPQQWLDKTTGEVIVDEKTLVLPSAPMVFAVGDVAKAPGAKRGYFAAEDAKVVAKNVIQALQGKKPTNKIQRMTIIILTMGSKGGRTVLPFTTLGPWTTSMIKSKDLFVTQFWKQIAPNRAIPKAD